MTTRPDDGTQDPDDLAPVPDDLAPALRTWIRAGQEGDAALAASVLAEDAVLVSPLTDGFPFRGRAEVQEILTAVLEVVHGIRYRRIDVTDTGAVLYARAMVDGVVMEEAQFLDLDVAGDIAHLTLFLRPLPAATRFLRAVGPVAARRQGRPGLARTLTAAGGFLDSVAASGDRRFLPLAAPPSARER